MPKSKREQQISLTQTQKKTRQQKTQLVEKIREAMDSFLNVYVFSVSNMRNAKLKELRREFSDSKFVWGKNRVLQIALGKDSSSEYSENSYLLSKQLRGERGLLFTNTPREVVEKFFEEYNTTDFARGGFIATETVALEKGPIDGFQHTMEPTFRKLGMPTKLSRGVIELLDDFTVCKEGDVLTPEQATILKLFNYEMAIFHVTLICVWSNGEFEMLREDLDLVNNPEAVPSGKNNIDVDSKDDAEDEDDYAEPMDMQSMVQAKIREAMAAQSSGGAAKKKSNRRK